MTFDHLRLVIAAFERVFYLSAIFLVLWIKGFHWAIFSIATFFLLATLLFAKPIIVDATQDENEHDDDDQPKDPPKS